MKFLKEKKGIIISFIIGVIIASSITVYATTYFASDITYIKDGKNLKVSEALDELFTKTKKDSYGINLLNFNNEQINSSYKLYPNSFENTLENGWYCSRASINYNFESNSDFEISTDISYLNNSSKYMGGPKIIFYNGNTEVCHFNIYDSWGSELKNVIYSDFNSQNLYSSTNTNSDCSGRYAIVKKNNKIYLYNNNNILNSMDFSGNIKITNIEIIFKKYPNYDLTDSYIKNIYIGDILNYKDN